KDIRRILREAFRVLKPGGSIICAPEPAASIFVRERDIQNFLEESQEGIVERRPKVYEYWWHLRQAGFRKISIDTFETHKATDKQIKSWIANARDNLMRHVRPLFRPIVWAAYTVPLLLPSPLAGFFVLCVNGGSILMHAEKASTPAEMRFATRVLNK